jgi:hypothetical protein
MPGVDSTNESADGVFSLFCQNRKLPPCRSCCDDDGDDDDDDDADDDDDDDDDDEEEEEEEDKEEEDNEWNLAATICWLD